MASLRPVQPGERLRARLADQGRAQHRGGQDPHAPVAASGGSAVRLLVGAGERPRGRRADGVATAGCAGAAESSASGGGRAGVPEWVHGAGGGGPAGDPGGRRVLPGVLRAAAAPAGSGGGDQVVSGKDRVVSCVTWPGWMRSTRRSSTRK